jgi:hypothetical protein
MDATHTPVATASSDMVARLHAKLSEYDIHVLCDNTGSMNDPNKESDPNGPTRWQAIQETLKDFCRFACEIDDDGINMGFFGGNRFNYYANVTVDQVSGILAQQQISGGTYMARPLAQMLAKAKGGKKDLVVVFLDGVLDDPEETRQVILNQANSQTADNECTILMIQAGDNSGATRELQGYDNDLVKKYGAKFDIVDTKTVAEVNQFGSFEELLANAIVD